MNWKLKIRILKKKHYKYPPIKPILFGGGQEHGFSPGTVPVALAAGLAGALAAGFAAAFAAGFAAAMLMAFVFPLQSHFQNTVSGTLFNSFRLGMAVFPRTFVMTFIWILPVLILVHVPALFPAVLMLGVSLPGYICCRLYEPVFKKME